MKQKLQNIFYKIKNIPFLQKKPLYLVLTIVLSILLLADVALAVLLPDTGNMGNAGNMQEMQMPGSDGEMEFGGDSGFADGGDEAEDADGDESDGESGNTADEDDENGSENNADTDESDAESDISTEGNRGDNESGESEDTDTDGASTDSESMTAMRGGASGNDESAGESSGMPDMSELEDGEMPDGASMGDGEMPDMSSGGNGEMPDMSSSGEDESGDLSSDEETDAADSSFGRGDAAGIQQNTLSAMSVLQTIRTHWLLILIILAVLDAGSIFMLIRISRRQKKEEEAKQIALLEQAADGEVHLARPKKKESKHSHYLWIIAVVVIVLLVLIVKSLTGQTASSGTETEATTYSETAELGDISTVLPGTGTLEEEDAEDLSLPDEVEITEWYVSNGDTVEEGDTLAAVDAVSVMTAIASVQDTLTSLDEALEDCEEDAVSGTITAAADGRVIKIYASADTSVVDTMYESDALMLLSLDGYMAVSFETDADISAGDSVDVTLSDGTAVSGKVESVASTMAVVILSDDGPELGDAVTVADEDGTVIGEGTLYIHSELKVTGFTGTVSSISVSEGDEVDSGDTLISLTDTDYTGEYELLLEQRAELETQMDTLFQLYEDGYLYASCSGVVSGLSDSADDISSDSGVDSEDSADESGSDTDSADDGTDTASASDTDTLGTSDTDSADNSTETANEADSASGGSSADADSTASSGTAGYQAQTLSCAGSSSAYLTIDSGQGTVVLTVSSVPESKSTLNNAEEGSSSATLSTSDDSPTVSTSADNAENGTVVDEDGTSDDEEASVTVYTGIVTAVSDGSVTISLLTNSEDEDGSVTLSLDTSASVTVYNGSASQGTVSDIAVGDVLIVSYHGDTLSGVVCISSSVVSSDSEESEEGTGTEGQSQNESGQETSTSEKQEDSAAADNEGEQQSGQTEGSETVSGEMSDAAAAGDTASDMTGTDTTTATEAEETASEALEEEVSSTYSVSETTWLAITPQDMMTIEITVDEMDILSVEIGQEAAITLDAFPGQSFTGTVTSIDESGTNSGGSSKYTAVITMDREDGMLAGMNASAVITLSTAEDVLLVSEDALVEENNTTYVYTTYDEETDTLGGLVEVTTGLSDSENVEITSGLEEGDAYCYSILDVVNYGSSFASSGSGSFSLESVFGGGGR